MAWRKMGVGLRSKGQSPMTSWPSRRFRNIYDRESSPMAPQDYAVEIERLADDNTALHARHATMAAALARIAAGEAEPRKIALAALKGIFRDETIAGLELLAPAP
jgi:hypothetical protein